MNYQSISELKKDALIREYSFQPNAFFQSRHFDPEKVLIRIEKVLFHFRINFSAL